MLGGALHKNYVKTIEIDVKSGVMENAEHNSDIQQSR